jgi:hypothetical protein
MKGKGGRHISQGGKHLPNHSTITTSTSNTQLPMSYLAPPVNNKLTLAQATTEKGKQKFWLKFLTRKNQTG